MKIVDADTTRTALPFDRLIDALRQMFISGCEVPLRHTHQLDDQRRVEYNGGATQPPHDSRRWRIHLRGWWSGSC